jgi:hypothetical protein
MRNLSARNWRKYFTVEAGKHFAYQCVTAFPALD